MILAILSLWLAWIVFSFVHHVGTKTLLFNLMAADSDLSFGPRRRWFEILLAFDLQLKTRKATEAFRMTISNLKSFARNSCSSMCSLGIKESSTTTYVKLRACLPGFWTHITFDHVGVCLHHVWFFQWFSHLQIGFLHLGDKTWNKSYPVLCSMCSNLYLSFALEGSALESLHSLLLMI